MRDVDARPQEPHGKYHNIDNGFHRDLNLPLSPHSWMAQLSGLTFFQAVAMETKHTTSLLLPPHRSMKHDSNVPKHYRPVFLYRFAPILHSITRIIIDWTYKQSVHVRDNMKKWDAHMVRVEASLHKCVKSSV